MRPVVIRGVGCTPIGEHWSIGLATLGATAVRAALADAGITDVDALVVGNMLSGVLCAQENLGACVAERAGLRGVEALKVEAACASGAAALRVGWGLVASRACDRVVVLGLEKMTDAPPDVVTQSLAFANAERDSVLGLTNTALAALLTQLYLDEHRVPEFSLASFCLSAYARSTHTSWSMFQKAVTYRDWLDSPRVSTPLGLYDCPANADGAAAVLLTSDAQSALGGSEPIEVSAIVGCSDSMSLEHRSDMLAFNAARRSFEAALRAADVNAAEVDLFEVHDAFPVVAALGLEAAGYFARGDGWRYHHRNEVDCRRVPVIQCMGGLKGKGHPVGASGIYQVIDVCTQLRGQAGVNQVSPAAIGVAQSLGGLAASAYTTVLRRRCVR
jgi:acetyl-CoA C-acetyltransferase